MKQYTAWRAVAQYQQFKNEKKLGWRVGMGRYVGLGFSIGSPYKILVYFLVDT